MTIVFQKSLLKSKHAKRIVADAKLTYFKEKVLEHLDTLERKEKKKEQTIQKALIEAECLRKAAYPVGTIREWKGKKYIKTAPGKWRRKYDKEGKGAKLAIAALKKKVDACKTSEDLLQLVLEHSDRFRDANGHPLPFVQELSEYVSKANDRLEGIKDRTDELFGPNYSKYPHMGKEGIKLLLKRKNGYIKAAYQKEIIGDIDIVYGKVTVAKKHRGYGLAHILDKHPEITPDIIDTIIQEGKVEEKEDEKGYNIRLGNYIVGVNTGYKRRKTVYTTDNYVVTSYEDRSNGESRLVTRKGFYKQNEPICLPNPSDKLNVPQTSNAVKKKMLEKKRVKKSTRVAARLKGLKAA